MNYLIPIEDEIISDQKVQVQKQPESPRTSMIEHSDHLSSSSPVKLNNINAMIKQEE